MSRHFFLLSGICIILLVIGVAFFIPDDEVTPYPPKNSTVVAFGDSLVAGEGATEGNDFVSVLSRTLERPIINMGVNGDTTADGIQRLPDVIAREPGIVLLLLGGNDSLKRIPNDVTERNLIRIIETLQQEDIIVILLGVRGGILSDPHEDMYQRISETYHIPYVENVLEGLFGKEEYMSDVVHPNDAGYARIADRVAEVFRTYKL